MRPLIVPVILTSHPYLTCVIYIEHRLAGSSCVRLLVTRAHLGSLNTTEARGCACQRGEQQELIISAPASEYWAVRVEFSGRDKRNSGARGMYCKEATDSARDRERARTFTTMTRGEDDRMAGYSYAVQGGGLSATAYD